MKNRNYVIGVDFGTDSVRALLIDTETGETAADGEALYPRWKQGFFQDPGRLIFRQHPQDYLDAFTQCMEKLLSDISASQREQICGIGIDTTGSTPAPVDKNGTVLAFLDEFKENENAMFWLWKDHSSGEEARELTELFRRGSKIDYCRYIGNYSAEWYWAKILHGCRMDEAVRNHSYSWVEHCDWIVGILTGNKKPETMYHSTCAAGFKALWNTQWDGLPPSALLEKADPVLARMRDHYGRNPQPAVVHAGFLEKEWTALLGLPDDVVVAGSIFDAHAGALGAGIREGVLVSSIGTSAAGMTLTKENNDAPVNPDILQRYGGIAMDTILPGYFGIETGQAAFGDLFAWLKRLLMWPVDEIRTLVDGKTYAAIREKLEKQMLTRMEKEARALPPEPVTPVALDWFNGRRYPDTDDLALGTISGLSLGTGVPELYRSLVTAAVCGMNRIICGFEEAGVPVECLKAAGGIPGKSDYIMQMLANITRKPVITLDATQAGALGAAICASIASGCFSTAREAVARLSAREKRRFVPDKREKLYSGIYQDYLKLAVKMEA